MGGKKQKKLRGIGRWTVWLCCFLVLVSIPISIWVRPMLMVVGLHPNYTKTMYGVRLVYARLIVERNPIYAPNMLFAAPSKTTWTPHVLTGVDSRSQNTRWWSAPSTDTGAHGARGPHRWVELPMVYIAVVLGVLSWWLWHGVERRRQLARCCVGCGYSLEGLADRVCPECGKEDSAG